MNKQPFQYSLLRYRHSYLLSEELNVGILFFFPLERRLEFLYPNHLQRISGLYPDFSTHTLRKYLKAFEKQAGKLNRKHTDSSSLFETSDLEELIEDYFLPKDATALLFTDVKKGTYGNAGQILDFYREQYLSVYEKVRAREHKDEQYILRKVDKGLKKRKLQANRAIRRNIKIKTNLFTEQFKYGWKNGTTNLITPIGLDLQKKQSIKEKAYGWHGKLDAFRETAQKENLRFDLILSRPDDKNLFKTYDNVLTLLEENKAPKKIIEVDEVDRYIDKINGQLA